MKILNLILICFVFSLQAQAMKIIQAKGQKVLIDLEGESVSQGQKIYLLNSAGKKVAIASITTVKGAKALAAISKGSAANATGVQVAGGGDTTTSETTTTTSRSSKNATKMSVLLNIGMNSMVTKQATAGGTQETVDLKGNSFGISMGYDKPLLSWVTLRGVFGYEPFVANGTATLNVCDNTTTTNCTASITYLSAGGWARFDFSTSSFQPWAALGATTTFPMGKSTTAFKSDDIKMTFTYGVGFGFDYMMGKSFIPASLEYQLFSSSDTVSANTMIIRAGYGWTF